MKQNIVVSIIIPVYCSEQYLGQCVESVINQTYQNLDIILVDDGSPDNAPMLCDDFSKRDLRIKVIHKTNGGLSSARNAGTQIAEGDYLMFLDSDDWLSLCAVELLLNAVTMEDSDVCVARHQRVYDEMLIDDNSNKMSNYQTYDSQTFLNKCYTEHRFGVSACSRIFKKTLFLRGVCFPDGMLYEDIYPTYRSAVLSNQLASIDNTIYYYRCTGESITRSNFRERDYDLIIQWKQCSEWAEKDFPNLNKIMFMQLHLAYLTLLGKICLSVTPVPRKMKEPILSFFCKNLLSIMSCNEISLQNKIKPMLAIISFPLYKIVCIKYRKKRLNNQ